MSAVALFTINPTPLHDSIEEKHVPEKRHHTSLESYPQGEFRNPLDIPMQLVANFGELRPNHYHMGLDIRTMQRENLPVYAAADGYIRKVKIEKSGFGNAIYIEHFNGYTTLYAHLNSFYPELAAYIKSRQYQTQSWEQEIDIDPELFPVKKGQFIALSGNTGGSQGPHLHFEIRDTETGNNLNPLLFGFGLPDHTPPSIYRLVYYDRNRSTYQGNPIAIGIRGVGGNYTALSNVVALQSPKISFGISADDMITNMHGHVGIYSAEVWMDDVLQTGFTLNDISYDETRYVNGSIDYKTKMKGGSYIQHISRLPGNKGSFFGGMYDGIISIDDSAVHKVKIVVKDVTGNTSTIVFNCRWNGAKEERIETANTVLMPPGKANQFETNDFKIMFSPDAFYDTIPFFYSTALATDAKAVSPLHHVADYTLPVHDSFSVQIKPTANLSENQKNRIVVHLQSNKRTEVEKGVWVDGMVQAKFKYLGNMMLLLDTIPPKITPSGWVNGGSLSRRKMFALLIKDDVEDVKNFKAYLDGNWLLFSRKSDFFIHTFDEKTTDGKHELRVYVDDEAGNTAEKIFTFYR